MKRIVSIFAYMLLCIFLFSACQKEPAVTNTPTPAVQADFIPQQPHSEATFEDMAAFINTVDADSFENGNFKNIIERVKNEGYLVRPYYDNLPAGIRQQTNQVRLSPENDNIGYPANFTYSCQDNNYLYTIRIFYIEPDLIPIAKEGGTGGLYYYQMGIQETNEATAPTRTAYEVDITGTDGYVTIIAARTKNASTAEFVWDNQYLIQINGNTIESENAHETINLELLDHLSFQKMPLTAATASTESPAPQPSDTPLSSSTPEPSEPPVSSTPQPSEPPVSSAPASGNTTPAAETPEQ